MEQLNSSRLRAACICGLILLLSTSLAAKTICVKWDSPGPTFDGASWDTAYHKVQEGLNAASPGDEVWVANGTYVECITLTTGVGLYGGFAGTETQRAERDWKANITILDGDRQGSVVTSPEGADNSTVIDGFIIQNGTGTTVGSAKNGGGIYCKAGSSPKIVHNVIRRNGVEKVQIPSWGGGVYCAVGASPDITNNLIFDNIATNGGGICCDHSAPTISNNMVSRNQATNGGAIACYYASAAIYNNRMVGNSATTGGGISCGYSTSTIRNNTIAANSAWVEGGGLQFSRSSLQVINNTIVSNGANLNGAGIHSRLSLSIVANNIIAFNQSGVCNYQEGAMTLGNNCLYHNAEYDYRNVSAGPGDISADPKVADAGYGNYHIQPDSPCVDAGDDSLAAGEWTDMDGQQRVLGSHVDIGADESDGTSHAAGPYKVVRVRPDGDDSNEGDSWSHAKKTIGAAIEDVWSWGGDVWVQSGTYYECVAIHPFAYVYGGFRGDESDKSDRVPLENETILDGEPGGPVVTFYSGYRASGVHGLTIQNGRGISGSAGTGVLCDNSSPIISHNRIINNSAGGIICERCAPLIAFNEIAENVGLTNGGGILCDGSAVIRGNTIRGNDAFGFGGGIQAWRPPRLIENNRIVGNHAGQSGGGIQGGGATLIANNTVAGNSAASGGGISWTYSLAIIQNNVVAFNSSGILYGSGEPVVRHNNVYGNGSYDYSGLPDPTGMNGNISLDPLFRDLEGGDYRLRPDSPCIDTGTNEGAPPDDILGFPRPVDGNCDGIAVTDMGAYEYQPIRVLVDILPGDPSNIIRLRANRQIPVAVLSTPTFDAREIDPTSVVFGPGRATEVHGRGHWEDVNRDGRIDLLLHFSCAATGLAPGMETATLYGRLTNGEWITGSDRINLR